MVLLRAPLGRGGSYLATALNVLQNLGWTVFELIVIAAAAAALSEQVFGFRANGSGSSSLRRATTALALLGPIGFVRRWVKRFALWVVLASLGYLTWWALTARAAGDALVAAGQGRLPEFWQGVDLVIAMPASWLPLAADYTRFSRAAAPRSGARRSATCSPNVWLFALGAILLLSRVARRRAVGADGDRGRRRRRRGRAARARRSTRPRSRSRTSTRPPSRSRTRCRACRSGC